MNRSPVGWLLAGISFFAGCSTQEETTASDQVETLFEIVPSSHSSVEFINQLHHTEQLNTYTYRNFYNGAGVAVADINNDGLLDIYFAGNQSDNKLYLNKGDLTFEDITEKAGVACENVWSTGISMADVNGDGWVDIYVCKSGPPEGPNRNNELFINNGDLTFTEKASEYGIDDKGLSNHAAFFDYDRDGDLDMYLLNNSLRTIGIYDLRKGQRSIRDEEGSNKLYRNDGDKFVDVSNAAGIYGSAIGFGLGVTVGDVNKDQWPDIYVSNDFFERDYLYINQHDGTFRESLESYMNETSMGSMGADIGDMNNDGFPEIYVTEMLPATLERIKTKTVFENWDKYQSDVRTGYGHQFTRNTLQLNNGPRPDSTAKFSFSEISRMTGTDATDWSWGALIFDADNDEKKDLFVANGIYKDLTDQDYINFYSNNNELIALHRKDSTILSSMIEKIPSVPLKNHFYLNEGNMNFTRLLERSGLDDAGFSNGSVYADLDNDGDLDLLINNVNSQASLYRNLSADRAKNHYLTLTLQGEKGNSAAFGTQVYLYTDSVMQYEEQHPVKGYMSTMDPRLHFGMASFDHADSIIIHWVNGSITRLRNVSADQFLTISETEGVSFTPKSPLKHSLLFQIRMSTLDTVRHRENDFVDFDRDRLLFEMYSNEGPHLATDDLNHDGMEDLVIGGAAGQSARIFMQTPQGSFRQLESSLFDNERRSEDVDVLIFDLDNDNDLDIYIASGGNEFSFADPVLKDRIYLNDGNGNFSRKPHILADKADLTISSAFVIPWDYDADGDPDLVVGERLKPFNYGVPCSAYLLNNDGKGNFTDRTNQDAPEFGDLGLLTTAATGDVTGDGLEELVMAGDWMAPVVFTVADKKIKKMDLDLPRGLYRSVALADLNEDGINDILLGNHGQNSRLHASATEPLNLFVGDYDHNGRIDHILSMYENGQLYPMVLLQDLSKQMPVTRKKFQTFEAYKDATVGEVLPEGYQEMGYDLRAEELRSLVVLSDGNAWKVRPLPRAAQETPVYSILPVDLDHDGHTDIILGGNQTRAKPELGIYNASYGVALTGDGSGNLTAMSASTSGLWVRGEIRDLDLIEADGRKLVVTRNNDDLEVFGFNE